MKLEMHEHIEETINALALKSKSKNLHAFVGFDGFIDRIQRAVERKLDGSNRYFKTIASFSNYLSKLKDKSGQIELTTDIVKIGGNAPILSNALGHLGVTNYCVGALGFPEVNRLFKTMEPHCNLISVNEPGDSRALEFSDGKIIFSELGMFDHFDWKWIIGKIELERLRELVNPAHLVSLVDWANLPHATDILQGFLDDVIKPSGRKDFLFLFDLCDPSKKSVEQIDEALDIISSYSHYGKVTLGLNQHETMRIWNLLNDYEPLHGYHYMSLPEAGQFIYDTMNIEYLLVHPVEKVLLYTPNGMLEMQGRVIDKPLVLTGAGDNLNAGFAYGWMLDLKPEQRVVLGIAAAGAYIQNGLSPTEKDLMRYLQQWLKEDSVAMPALT